MSNRGDFVGTAPNSGVYVPSPTPADQEDLPVYINDELLRLGGTVNGVLEGGALPPHSELPKRYKEGMIMNFSKAVGDGVDSSGVWLYKKAKWWKLIDDPTEITEEINKKIDEINKDINTMESDLNQLNIDLKELNDVLLPQLNADLAELEKDLTTLNDTTLPALEKDLAKATEDIKLANVDLTDLNNELSTLKGKFPITSTEITDGAISTPKLAANSVTADKILANSIGADKIAANSITGDKIVANTITGDKIVANSVSGEVITANTFHGDKILANTIRGDKLVVNSINGDRIIANSIAGDKILANSIGADKLVANSITGGKISSATTIRAGSGNQSASLDGADATWRLYAGNSTPANAPFRVDKNGNLFANSGTFGGKIYAEKVDGDFTAVAIKKVPDGFASFTTGVAGKITPNQLFKFRVMTPKPYDRYVKVDPISFDFNQNSNKSAYHMLATGIGLDPSGNTVGPEQELIKQYDAWWWQKPIGAVNETNYSPSITVRIPAHTRYQVTVSLGVEVSSKGGKLWQQDLVCTLFKQGTEISFV